MGSFWIAFLAAIGAGGWIYGKTQRHTGNNTQTSLITAGVSGLAMFIILWLMLKLFM